MKKIVLIFSCLLIVCIAGAQNRKIAFQENEAWSKVVKNAKKKNQLIFMDCYTTWCGPCKMLDKNVFTNDEVADYYNENFCNAKYDMEKGEGIQLRERYEVSAFPTLLYIDPQTEEVVHRIVGAGDVSYFLVQGKLANDPENNLAGLKKKFEEGGGNPELLKNYLDALTKAGQTKVKSTLTIDYLNGLTTEQLAEAGNWELLDKNVNDILSAPIQKVIANKVMFEKAIGKREVDDKITAALAVSAMEFQSQRQIEPNPDFNQERFDQLLSLAKTIDNPGAPACIAQLSAAGYAQNREYSKVIEVLEDALKYNLVQGRFRTMFLMLNMAKLTLAEDETVRKEAINFVDDLIAVTPDSFTQSSFYQMKSQLLRSYGDEAGAEKAKEDAQLAAREGEIKSGGRAIKAGMMN